MAKREPEVTEDRQTIQREKDNQKSQRTVKTILVIFFPLYCLSVLLFDFWLSFCHCIVCLSFSVTSGYNEKQKRISSKIQWQKDNQKSQKRTDRQYNGKKITRSHREGQTDNTMANR
jgi:hypothetical protein